VGQAAAENERPEQQRHPPVLGQQVGPLAHEGDDGQRDAEVGRGDDHVGDDMQRQDVWSP
jgi:hypothetical protein